jgi:GNAT superfamily N-acetyltransferase
MGEAQVYSLAGVVAGHTAQVRRAVAGDHQPLCDWADVGLQGDYFMRRGHLANLMKSPNTAVWVVEVDGYLRGLMILYRDSVLHNLYLSPEVRQLGIGSALLALFRPQAVRAKTNMGAGDPSPFYRANGYGAPHPDPERPHIHVMTRLDQHAEAQQLPYQPGPNQAGAGNVVEISARTGLPKRQVSEATKERLRGMARQQRLDRARALLAAAGEVVGIPSPTLTPPAATTTPAAAAGTAGPPATGIVDRLPTGTAPEQGGLSVTSDRAVSPQAITSVTVDDGAWALPPQTV